MTLVACKSIGYPELGVWIVQQPAKRRTTALLDVKGLVIPNKLQYLGWAAWSASSLYIEGMEKQDIYLITWAVWHLQDVAVIFCFSMRTLTCTIVSCIHFRSTASNIAICTFACHCICCCRVHIFKQNVTISFANVLNHGAHGINYPHTYKSKTIFAEGFRRHFM